MASPNPTLRMISPRKRVFFHIILYASLLLTLVCSSEGFLRLRGAQPWSVGNIRIRFEPGGTFYKLHPTLGYTHLPGVHTVTLEDGFAWVATHMENDLRVTHPLNSYDPSSTKEEIWVFGDSFTHGWSLNDFETFPWLLQQRLPQ